ncbi:Retrovirus-related Pol polyprotein from transposon RE2 [Vitis vinifera]|uniref:Retrovirus-related Pol polyprotein from transposon RE2 n=1 Tax=Vitis vinifera TaxID=29760 RepID=A0A438CF18_VITVI|nr:Retrovirus-related Pol polyprotein from transposon RE2 [Vitis vinifera]
MSNTFTAVVTDTPMAQTLPVSNALSDNACSNFSNSTTGFASLPSCPTTGTTVPIVDNIVSITYMHIVQPITATMSQPLLHTSTNIHSMQTSYFLGFEAFRDSSSLYLNQAKYISNLLVKKNMVHVKPSSTPMTIDQKLALEDSAPFPDVTLYRSTIGALQYLTSTRPDISFSVNKLSQFLKAPTQHHWSAYKRLLRYVSGTHTLGLSF